MPTNYNMPFPNTPIVGIVKIPTSTAQVKSAGTSAGSGTDLMYCILVADASGTFVQQVEFRVVADAAAVTSVQTTARVYMSTVTGTTGNSNSGNATTSANTQCIGEINIASVSASNSTLPAAPYILSINKVIPSGYYIYVSQHVGQAANQYIQATLYGGHLS